METTTIRVPTELRDTLKILASIEKTNISTIISALIEEYIESHRETLELLSNPDWLKQIEQGKKEVKNNTKGVSLDELDD